jgi:hypothetical protein
MNLIVTYLRGDDLLCRGGSQGPAKATSIVDRGAVKDLIQAFNS